MHSILYLSCPAEVAVRQVPRRDRRDIRVWKVEGSLVQESAAALKFLADEIVDDAEGLEIDLTLASFVDAGAVSILQHMQRRGVIITGHERIGVDLTESDSPLVDRQGLEAFFGNSTLCYA
ncbi:MAG: hypothetical protein KIT79_02910 [Deltaproteobacteria bacterium]|nr:hypothetical protein [Deltaproteobacteria bacterium]